LNLVGMVDFDAEIARLEKALTKNAVDKATLLKKTAAPDYSKVPKEVQEKNKQALEAFGAEAQSLEAAIGNFRSLKSTGGLAAPPAPSQS